MAVLVLVRHGESRWNLENRFTGWVDVPLTEKGLHEAEHCAVHCASYQYAAVYTSRLLRAQETLLVILSRQNRTGVFQHTERAPFAEWIRRSNILAEDNLPVYATLALDERYYGDLQGLIKAEAERRYGKELVMSWRRGFLERPPNGESLAEAYARTLPFVTEEIFPRVQRGENVLVTAHGNTLRNIVKKLEGLSDEQMPLVELPEASPLIYEYQENRFVRIEGDYGFNRPLR